MGTPDQEIRGNGQNNWMHGDIGHDHMWGYGGRDFLVGWGSADEIWGGSGNDTIFGDFTFDDGYTPFNPGANDILRGGGGRDIIVGGEGNDKIYGGSGRDHIWGEQGYDELRGGGGADTFYFIVDSGHHSHDTHLGHDTIYDYSANDTLVFSGHVRSDWIYDFGDDVFIATDEVWITIRNAEVSDVRNSIIDGVSFETAWYDMSDSMWVYGN